MVGNAIAGGQTHVVVVSRWHWLADGGALLLGNAIEGFHGGAVLLGNASGGCQPHYIVGFQVATGCR